MFCSPTIRFIFFIVMADISQLAAFHSYHLVLICMRAQSYRQAIDSIFNHVTDYIQMMTVLSVRMHQNIGIFSNTDILKIMILK